MSPRHQDAVRTAAEQLIRAADIEIIPLKGADQKLAAVPAGSTVTVTCSPKFGLDRTLEHCVRAAAAGYRVVPHLAARQVRDEAELRAFLARLDVAGITDLYVIGGDATEPAGPYRDAGDLVGALSAIEHGITSIGVACYPEGHPTISDSALAEALRRKQPHVHYMVSQLCFDPDVLSKWLRAARAAGITLPLHVGLAAPLNTRRLLELSLKIGVGPSLRYLTKQHGMLGNLLLGTSYRPEKFLHGLGEDLLSDELAIDAVHLFSFNQLDATVEWQQRVAGTTDVPEVEDSISTLAVGGLLDAVASNDPTPGGGTVAGVATSLAAALAAMAGRYAGSTSLDELVARADTVRQRAIRLADADRAAYQVYVEATKQSREPDPEPRRQALRAALDAAADAPHELSGLAADVSVMAAQLAEQGNPRLRSDACAAALLGSAAAASAAILVRENLHATPADRRVATATRNARVAATAARSALTIVGLELDDRITT